MLGEFERAIEDDGDDTQYISASALLCLGRQEEALAMGRSAIDRSSPSYHLRLLISALTAFAGRDRAATLENIRRLEALPAFSDPEGYYYWSLAYAGIDERERALELLERMVENGFHAVRALEVNPFLRPLASDPRFIALLARAREKQARSEQAFAEADGPRLLGLQHPPRFTESH